MGKGQMSHTSVLGEGVLIYSVSFRVEIHRQDIIVLFAIDTEKLPYYNFEHTFREGGREMHNEYGAQ